MIPANIINRTEGVVKQFASAIQEKDFELIASLLADDGKFNTQDAELNNIGACSKTEFMQWFIPVLSAATIEKIKYDQCLHCRIGNPVVLFKGGKFPRIKKDLFVSSIQGYMLEIADGLIKEIKFCYTFLDRKNKSQLECMKPKIDKLIVIGCSVEQSIRAIGKIEGYLIDGLTREKLRKVGLSFIRPRIYRIADANF